MAPRVGFILCLAAACALGAGAASALADGGGTTTTTTTTATPIIADGVEIGSVAVGGMTADGATAAVQQAYSAPVVLHVGHHDVQVSPRRFHTALPTDAAVQTALTAAADTVVPFKPTLDLQLVRKWVKKLAAKTDTKPAVGRLVLHHSRPFMTRAHAGRRVAGFATAMLIRNAVRSGARTTIVVPLRKLVARSSKAAPVIVIHRGLNRLMLFDGTRLVRTFPVATGMAQYPSPLGRFQIVVKWKNPWWYPPTQDAWAKGLSPVPPGPDNPLGTRWMGISSPGVGIHGTDEPWSIGHSESHGCIRMQVPSAEWLFNRVQVGTTVFIVAR